MEKWMIPKTRFEQDEMQQGMTDLDRYYADRDRVVPFVEQRSEIQSPAQPVVTLSMKRYFAAGSFTTFCVVVIAAAEQGAFAAAAAIGGHIALVGGGVGLAWVILRACFTWSPDEPKGGQAQQGESGQNIRVTVNVAGQNVSNGKQ